MIKPCDEWGMLLKPHIFFDSKFQWLCTNANDELVKKWKTGKRFLIIQRGATPSEAYKNFKKYEVRD